MTISTHNLFPRNSNCPITTSQSIAGEQPSVKKELRPQERISEPPKLSDKIRDFADGYYQDLPGDSFGREFGNHAGRGLFGTIASGAELFGL